MTNKSLKKIQANLLKTHRTIPCAFYHYYNGTAPSSSNLSASSTWYYPSSNSNGAYAHEIYDSEYFSADQNGFNINKHGIYYFFYNAHVNQVNANACTATLRLLNYTDNQTVVPYSDYLYTQTSSGYCSPQQSVIAEINANKCIALQINRYSSGTANSKWRITQARFGVILLRDLELDPLPTNS